MQQAAVPLRQAQRLAGGPSPAMRLCTPISCRFQHARLAAGRALPCRPQRLQFRAAAAREEPTPQQVELEPAAAEAQVQSRPRWGLASAALPSSMLLSATVLLSASGLLGTGFSLETPASVVQALAVLAAIVTVHECGHFLAARWQGIHVTKFSIGFGPALWKYQGPEVEYSLRAIPLGGFVAFPDDDADSPYPDDDPDLLKNRPIPQRAAVISAGVVANMVFALAVLLLQVGTVGKAETAYLPGVRVPEVIASSAAERGGLQRGDIILRVGKYEVTAIASQVPDVVDAIRARPQQAVPFLVQRGGQPVELTLYPDLAMDGSGKIGVQLQANAFINHVKASSVPEAVKLSVDEFKRLCRVVFNGLSQIFTNFSQVSGQLSGPVAIIAAGSEIARTDSAGLFQFCAIVNINLAAVNVLPLPALDGGYLLLLSLEALRGGKKLPQRLEQGVMTSGILLLTVLGVGLVIRDTLNLL